MYTTLSLWLSNTAASGAPGSSTENCLPQSCRLLTIHYGDAQHLNHDAEDFDQWSGLVDLCQSGTAVITFSMIPIARSRVSIAPTRSISSATKISAARPGRLSISQRAPSAARPDRPGSRRATGRRTRSLFSLLESSNSQQRHAPKLRAHTGDPRLATNILQEALVRHFCE